MRLHVSGMSLPADADLYLLSRTGRAFGPYQRRGPNGDGDFWTHTARGSEGILMLRHYGPHGKADLHRSSFMVKEIGHVTPKFAPFGPSAEAFCEDNAPCIEGAGCHNGTPADPAKDAVAMMQWIAGAWINTCTGGLLADTAQSGTPWFLTANHCLSSNKNAGSLETYFQYSISCGGEPCVNPGGAPAGDPCDSDADCCSDRCKGKPGAKTCR